MRRRSAGSAARCKATDAGAGDHRQLTHRDPVELPIPHAGYQAAEPWRRGRDGEDARPARYRADGSRPEHRPSAHPAIEADAMPYLGGGIGRYRPRDGMFDDSFRGIWGDHGLATRVQGEKYML